ncbi:hypothetical protein GA0115259_1020125 [Streptomyces sp. MnatMP-M17]|nr:hypothetical protein GA0115259_1020125 [Streptomyces sp. MnatMP-M17]
MCDIMLVNVNAFTSASRLLSYVQVERDKLPL